MIIISNNTLAKGLERLQLKKQLSLVRKAYNAGATKLLQAARRGLCSSNPRISNHRSKFSSKKGKQAFRKKIHKDIINKGISLINNDPLALWWDRGTSPRYTKGKGKRKRHYTGKIDMHTWWYPTINRNTPMAFEAIEDKLSTEIVKIWSTN